MSIIDAKCPNCGAPLKVNKDEEAAVCEYCGKAFIVEKAIKINGGDYVKGDKIVNNVKQDNEWSYKKFADLNSTINNNSQFVGMLLVLVAMIVMLAISAIIIGIIH